VADVAAAVDIIVMAVVSVRVCIAEIAVVMWDHPVLAVGRCWPFRWVSFELSPVVGPLKERGVGSHLCVGVIGGRSGW
jgi:hypothetical protein